MENSSTGGHGPHYLYRLSWRREGWAPTYWRSRYCSEKYMRVLVGRLRAANTGEIRVQRVPLDAIEWADAPVPGEVRR